MRNSTRAFRKLLWNFSTSGVHVDQIRESKALILDLDSTHYPSSMPSDVTKTECYYEETIYQAKSGLSQEK